LCTGAGRGVARAVGMGLDEGRTWFS
jgi:hypothetical protein